MPASAPSSTALRTTLIACVSVVGVMVCLAYAAVPLYRLFCQVTGYGGTTQVASSGASTTLDRFVTVRFDSNVAPGLNWKFKPESPTTRVKIGETTTIFFRIENAGTTVSSAQATYNVQPDLAGLYFDKLQCFCFSELTLKPGEAIDAPVVFFVDPDIVKEADLATLDTITLSYTFFPSKGQKSPVAELTGAPKPQL